MNKGIAIIERNDKETKAVFVDMETVEMARLNARVSKNCQNIEKAHAKAVHKQNKEEREKAKRKAYTVKTLACFFGNCIVSLAVAWAWLAGLIHPIIAIPVSVVFQWIACVRIGAWFGKMVKR